MRLSKIKISNLRSIDEIEIDLVDYCTLIGANNSGKSSILRGLELILNNLSPDHEEFRWNEDGTQEDRIIIEAKFTDINDWERRIQGISSLVNQNEIYLRYIAENEEGKITKKFEAKIQEEDITGYSESWGTLSDEIKEKAQEIEITTGTQWRTKASKETVKQHLRDNYPELITLGDEIWTDEGISIAPALKQGLPEAVIIPAVKDAKSEEKPTGRNVFRKLFDSLVLPDIIDSEEFQEVIAASKKLEEKLSGSEGEQFEKVKQLTDSLNASLNSIINASASISMAPPDGEKLVSDNSVIRLNDGIETPIAFQGHGAQRSLIFALFEAIADLESKSLNEEESQNRPILLLFEEPELYIHPHLLRRLKKSLIAISQRDNWQVICSTHSPIFINISDHFKSLVILSRGDGLNPQLKQLEADPFRNEEAEEYNEKELLRAVLDFNPHVNEAFFAKRSILVEGDSEVAMFMFSHEFCQKAGIESEKIDYTSIISCDGKWTILPMARLLQEFDIPFKVIHDIDKKGRTEEELAALPGFHPYNFNAKIEDLLGAELIFKVDDTLEDLLFNEGENPEKDKPFKAWEKMKSILEEDDISSYNELIELFKFTFED